MILFSFQVTLGLCPSSCSSCTSETECQSCNPGFYMNASSCLQCDQQCDECINSAKNCTKCKQNTYLTNNQCQQSCPEGTFKNDKSLTCEKCVKDCQICSASGLCDKCQIDFYKFIDQTCVKKCDEYYFGDPLTRECTLVCSDKSYYKNTLTKKCEQCDTNCLTCDKTSNNCKSCPENNFILKKECTENCQNLQNNIIQNCINKCPPEYFYPDQSKECLPCYQGCINCNGPKFDQCTKCKSEYLQNENKCLRKDCKDYFYANPENNECQKCSNGCKMCDNDKTCNQCIGDKNPDNTCKNPCEIGQYITINQNNEPKCKKCNDKCKECFGESYNQCTECDKGQILVDGKCECDKGYYKVSGTLSCEQCDNKCSKCSQIEEKIICSECKIQNMILNNGKCECKDKFILQDDKSICICKDDHFLFENDCYRCHSSCKTCIGPNITDCTQCSIQNQTIDNDTKQCSCEKGFYFDKNSQLCSQCDLTCDSCMTSQNTDCFKCKNIIGLSPSNSFKQSNGEFTYTCSCPKGQYFNKEKETMKCTECSPNCKECNGGGDDNCLECPDPLMKIINKNRSSKNYGKCECISTYFFNTSTKQCEKCHFSCDKCIGSTNNQCITCSDPNAIVENNKCTCQIGFFFDNFICQKCHENCKTCNGPKNTDCTSCISENMQPSPQNQGKCVCSSGLYYNLQKGCIKCFGNCKKCNGETDADCLECEEGINFIRNENKQCVCENGFFETINSNNMKQCLICNSLCNNCDKDGKCITCKNQLMKLSQDKSTCECISGYTLFENECQQCPSLCSKCQVINNNQTKCISCSDTRTMVVELDQKKCKCKDKYYNYGDQCIACSPLCATCSGITDKECIQCSDQLSMTKDLKTGICTCQNHLIFDHSTGKCVFEKQEKCKDPKCLKCNENECFKCVLNYLPNGDVCTCHKGYYDLGNSQGCIKCEQESCTSCKSANECDECETGLIQFKGQCFCQNSMFKNNKNQCTKPCPSKCKICSDPLNCFLTTEEADEQNYQYCDSSCGKCSGPSYYECWECSSNTRQFDEILKTCFCKNGYKEVYQKDCIQSLEHLNVIAKHVSISSGILTFSSIFLSTIIDSTMSIQGMSGFSSLFMYSFGQYQIIGNLMFINKAFPMGIEQNYFNQFFKMNIFNLIPIQYTPLNEKSTHLSRNLIENSPELNSDEQHQTQQNENILFDNPKFHISGLDVLLFAKIFYPVLIIILFYIIIGFLFFFEKKSQFIQNMYINAKWNLILKTIVIVSNSCLLSAFINLRYLMNYSSSHQLNLASVCIFCFLYFSGFLYLFYKINFSQLSQDPCQFQNYFCLHNKICQENFFTKNFWLIIEFRKIVQLSIIVFVSTSLPCIWTIQSISIVISIIMLLKKPFLQHQMNIFFFISEISLSVIYLIISVIITFSSIAKIGGYILIFLLCFFQLNSVLSSLYFIAKWLLSLKNNNKTSNVNPDLIQFHVKQIQHQNNSKFFNKSSLELPNLHLQDSFKDQINSSFHEMDPQVKWNKNPILLNKQSKMSTNQKTQLSITKQKSSFLQKGIEKKNDY